MQNILFRADSSSTLGTGHIMRDLVLAGQFEEANIIFATQALDGNINHKIEEKNYPIEILHSNAIQELDALIKKRAIDMIIIDHYGIDLAFEKQLKTQNPQLKILSFDDTYEKHCCDILLNHNFSADPERYQGLLPEHCELRCGSQYTLLREEFTIEKQKGRQNSNDPDSLKVFIGMGGADHSNLNVKILDVLKDFPTIHAHVVTTSANQHLSALQEYAAGNENITLHINTDTIAALMNKADFAIVTPSVTVNEIIYLNVPFIAIKTAGNQDDMYHFLKEKKFPVLESSEIIKLSEYVNSLIKSHV